jgi:hypothetical protein
MLQQFLLALGTNDTAASAFVLSLQAAGMNVSYLSVIDRVQEQPTSARRSNAKLAALAVLACIPAVGGCALAHHKLSVKRRKLEESPEEAQCAPDSPQEEQLAAAPPPPERRRDAIASELDQDSCI